jgi:hypothetical protein
MRNGAIASLLVVAILVGAGLGYFVTSQEIAMKTVTTTITGSCPKASAQYGSGDFVVEVSYQGPWNATVSTYSAFDATLAYLLSACHYGGIGTAYVSVASPNPNGEQTVLVAAQKLDSSNGNLTVTVTYGGTPPGRSNSTTLPFGLATTYVSTAP